MLDVAEANELQNYVENKWGFLKNIININTFFSGEDAAGSGKKEDKKDEKSGSAIKFKKDKGCDDLKSIESAFDDDGTGKAEEESVENSVGDDSKEEKKDEKKDDKKDEKKEEKKEDKKEEKKDEKKEEKKAAQLENEDAAVENKIKQNIARSKKMMNSLKHNKAH